MKIYKNLIPKSFIDKINHEIDKVEYLNYLYIFNNKNSHLHNLICAELSKLEIFKWDISNAHVVIRCAKKNDKKICYSPHFDNYVHTYVIPIMVPSIPPFGDLCFIENFRSAQTNVYMNTITKFAIQNPLVCKVLLKYFGRLFKSADIKPGDVALFHGLTTLHYNNSVSTERRSILIHLDNPFKKNLINRIIEYFGMLNVK